MMLHAEDNCNLLDTACQIMLHIIYNIRSDFVVKLRSAKVQIMR